jgi:hypothetical protein
MEQVILFQSLTLGNLVYGASQNSLHFPPFLAYSEQGLLFPNCYCEDDLTVGGGEGGFLLCPRRCLLSVLLRIPNLFSRSLSEDSRAFIAAISTS